MSKATVPKKKQQKTNRRASNAMRSPASQPVIMRWRLLATVGICAILATALLWHIARLQVLPSTERGYKFLQTQGQARSLRVEVINANRGVITDRNGEPLAVSSPVLSVCANPQVLMEARDQWQPLAEALGVPPRELADQINRYSQREFMYLRRHLAPATAQEILERDFPGVFPQQEYQRFYPAGEVAAHLVGFTNIDDAGQEGIELAYETWLRGTPGAKQVMKDRRGRTIEEVRLLNAAQPGKDLSLSMDLRLQYMTYRALKSAVTQHDAVSGSAVILDSATGEVLAMVNQPSFNPNNRRSVSAAAVRNRAMTDLFEPGSTMKPLTVLAAMETGKYKPHTTIDTSPGYVRVPGKIFQDPVNYGVMDVTKVITKSSNVGTTKIAMDLDPDYVRNFFFRMGLGQSTGSGFPGESTGDLPNHSPWSAVERATFAFGHGLQVTTLQLAQAYSVIANGGQRKPVSLLRLGENESRQMPVERVLDERLGRQMLAMMETVLEPGGTATRARLQSYTAAGKTGTARKVEGGDYSYDAAFSVFAGIAPASDPRIVVVVMINEARKGYSGGGEVAAPVFADIAENALRILQVAPDKSEAQFTQHSENKGPLS
ncbi:peptidoglycan D,D-transpeptidase FtsI family protein [Gilvimarinus sp. F26214L]|uniref:peptidoglycan D,D-transpeptidase FtsI family protein n=1 Tax=Gilvimarinus sp. DZF01 TaxID=3461371 RepID=UPI0040458582